jgi:4-aminobutyrate aminotransferase / (S)-3-amino-2-methylpropionate transaminase / 5-aminovalerate transaminase
MASSFEMIPRRVRLIETEHRKIATEIPNAKTLEIIEQLRKYEPISMSGQPPVVWDKAEGFNVWDGHGNKWIDFSSGVLVANMGHANPEVKKAIIRQVESGLLHNYCFPSEIRARLVKTLSDICPEPLKKVFLLTTGAETTECAIKLARTYGQRIGGRSKIKIVTFDDAFHGRTMGAQTAGGVPKAKAWIANLDPDFHQVPFPNAFKYEWADDKNTQYTDEKCFGMFIEALDEQGVIPNQIAGIMSETFQGGWVQLMPVGFARRLKEFCEKYGILLIFDEVQAGFGRSGKLFSFQHYGIVPDMVCCGKGISSSLPISALIGRPDVMDLYGPNEMTSTHTGNPVCAAAAQANIEYMVNNAVIENADVLGRICRRRIEAIAAKHSRHIGYFSGCGLAWALMFVTPGTKEINPALAHEVVRISMEKGLLFFAPVGAGATIKVCPPLVITEEALLEGLEVLDEAIGEACGGFMQ